MSQRTFVARAAHRLMMKVDDMTCPHSNDKFKRRNPIRRKQGSTSSILKINSPQLSNSVSWPAQKTAQQIELLLISFRITGAIRMATPKIRLIWTRLGNKCCGSREWDDNVDSECFHRCNRTGRECLSPERYNSVKWWWSWKQRWRESLERINCEFIGNLNDAVISFPGSIGEAEKARPIRSVLERIVQEQEKTTESFC
jgi:hypothetical protein